MLNMNERQLVWKYCCYRAGPVYYDITLRLLEQVVSWVEADIDNNQYSFSSSFEKMQLEFTEDKCLLILDKTTETVRQELRYRWMQELLGYFTWARVGLSFLLLLIVWIAGQYFVPDRFAVLAIIALNVLNISIVAENSEVVYSNNIEKLIGFEWLEKKERGFFSLPLLYSLVSILNIFGWILPQTANDVLLYIFPFVLLLSFAWKQTAVIAYEQIKKDYPAAFAE
jgi:hypothetical protein